MRMQNRIEVVEEVWTMKPILNRKRMSAFQSTLENNLKQISAHTIFFDITVDMAFRHRILRM